MIRGTHGTYGTYGTRLCTYGLKPLHGMYILYIHPYLFIDLLFHTKMVTGFDDGHHFGKDTASAIGSIQANAFLESRQKVSKRKVHPFTESGLRYNLVRP